MANEVKAEILGIEGSPRKGGNSDTLLKHILKGVKQESVPGRSVHLRDYLFQPCIGCEKCRKGGLCVELNDGMQLLYPEIIKARGMVFVCPTHNYNVTAWMKAFIDRLYCFYHFDMKVRPRAWSSRLANQGRKAVISALCEQKDQKDMGFTLDAMRLPLQALGYEIIAELPVFSIFDKGKVADYPQILAQAENTGQRLARAISEQEA